METKVITGRKIVFKPYDQNQFVRLPIQIEELIAPGHLVSIIDGLVEQLKMEDLYVDGSKWEANANRLKVVWAKNTAGYKAAALE